MRKLTVFNQVSLDGFICDLNGDMSWAHKHDAEWNAFVADNARGGGALLFGRVTYQMMASYWPTPAALANMPVVAERMNVMPKLVFSKTLREASWLNTTLFQGDLAGEVRRIKRQDGPDIVIFGSGSIVSQLTQERLIDAYQVVVNPVVLGQGKAMFAGVKQHVPLQRTATRTFSNGNVLLNYELAT